MIFHLTPRLPPQPLCRSRVPRRNSSLESVTDVEGSVKVYSLVLLSLTIDRLSFESK